MTNISAIHRVLGPAFDQLPKVVRDTHDHDGPLLIGGVAEAQVTPGFLPRLICALIGLPRHGSGQSVTVSLETDAAGQDFWRRSFNGRKYKSRLAVGTGRHIGKLVERQGLMTNIFSLTATPDRLLFTLEGFAIAGVPLPRGLRPRCDAFETVEGDKFVFDITIDMPLIGRLIAYRGVAST